MKLGVYLKHRAIEIELSKDDLQLIADALEAINPDSDAAERKARQLAASFQMLSEYAASLK